MRICNSCRKELLPEEFWRQRASKDGLSLCCKDCAARTNRRQRQRNYHTFWAASVLASHKKRGVDISIDRDTLAKIALKTPSCPRCNSLPKWESGQGLCSNSPTVDRIDNNLGLTAENSEIVCLRCNAAKGQYSMTDYREWLDRAHRIAFLEKYLE